MSLEEAFGSEPKPIHITDILPFQEGEDTRPFFIQERDLLGHGEEIFVKEFERNIESAYPNNLGATVERMMIMYPDILTTAQVPDFTRERIHTELDHLKDTPDRMDLHSLTSVVNVLSAMKYILREDADSILDATKCKDERTPLKDAIAQVGERCMRSNDAADRFSVDAWYWLTARMMVSMKTTFPNLYKTMPYEDSWVKDELLRKTADPQAQTPPDYMRDLEYLRLLYPEEFEKKEISDAFWKQMREYIKSQMKEAFDKGYLLRGEDEQAIEAMKVLAAKEVHFTANGIELVNPAPQLVATPTLPITKEY